VEFTVDRSDYSSLEKLTTEEGVTRDEAIRIVLIEGMRAYRSRRIAEMISDYTYLEKRIQEYRNDNAALNRLYDYNSSLKRLFGETSPSEEEV